MSIDPRRIFGMNEQEERRFRRHGRIEMNQVFEPCLGSEVGQVSPEWLVGTSLNPVDWFELPQSPPTGLGRIGVPPARLVQELGVCAFHT